MKKLKRKKPDANIIKGGILTYPLPIATRYGKELRSLVNRMIADYEKDLRPELEGTFDATPKQMSKTLEQKGRKWSKIFSAVADKLAEFVTRQVTRYSASSTRGSLKSASQNVDIGALEKTPRVNKAISAAVVNNVALIKSMADEYHDKVAKSVLNSVATGGKGAKQVFDDIRAIGKVTNNRAKLIAVDQTRKITSSINVARMQDAGIQEFEWIHSHGSTEPRQLHLDYDGRIFSMDDPPVIDERTGEIGYPGALINCRCRMRAIIRLL